MSNYECESICKNSAGQKPINLIWHKPKFPNGHIDLAMSILKHVKLTQIELADFIATFENRIKSMQKGQLEPHFLARIKSAPDVCMFEVKTDLHVERDSLKVLTRLFHVEPTHPESSIVFVHMYHKKVLGKSNEIIREEQNREIELAKKAYWEWEQSI